MRCRTATTGATANNQTFRPIIKPDLWGNTMRFRFSNTFGSQRLSPRARVGSPLLAIGAARFLSRRFDEAIPKLLLAELPRTVSLSDRLLFTSG